MTIPYDIVQVK